MSPSDMVRKELADIELKLASAREAAAAPGASEREKADLKLIEQEYLAARRKAYREADSRRDANPPRDAREKVDKKLDDALKASFPGSDPVSFVEAAPVKEQDRSLPEVELADRQAPEKASAAKKKTN